MQSFQLHSQQSLNTKKFHRVQTKMVWFGLPTSNSCLLAEFILEMEAMHILLTNFAGPIIIIVSQKLHEWKCAA
jgi:hypothetical protein